jgi:hypothetical protein
MPVTRFCQSARQRFGYTFLRSRVAVSVFFKALGVVLLRNQSAARLRAALAAFTERDSLAADVFYRRRLTGVAFSTN